MQAVERLVIGWTDTKSTTDALTAFGLQAEQALEKEELGIWPENWVSFQVMRRMLTQLSTSFSGAVLGLRYEALPVVLDIMQVPSSERVDMFDALQIMERQMVRLLSQRI
jgi:hypothetical protein